jgi:flagellar motor switch protein FliN/FliY
MAEPQIDIDTVLAEAEALAREANDRVGAAPAAPPAEAEDLDQAVARQAGKPLDRVLKLEVPVIVRLAQRAMRLSDILGLSIGSIIEFDNPFDAELELVVNNECIGRGQAVKVGEKFGLRVTGIGTLREKIGALAKP